jgi:glycosyltransferase involved in cell wall biosynthesis
MKAAFAIKSMNTAGGGAERVLAEVVNHLAKRGHDVSVVTFDGPGRSFYPLSGAVQRVDLQVGHVGESTPRGELLAAMPRLRHSVTSLRPDVVVGFMHSMFIPLGFALIGSGLPVIASEHVGMRHYRTVPAERALLEAVPWLTVASTIPSAEVRAGFPPRLRRRMVAIPNPVTISSSAQPGRSVDDRTGGVILTVGRFFSEKNHTDLIAAFAQVAPDHPNWTLRLAGDGALRADLERQVRELGLGPSVEFAGTVRDIASEYARADIVAVPSLHESFGLVTAEALAAGCPVVGFEDCPGTRELVHHELNGLLVPGEHRRIRSLADGLRRLMRDDALRARLGAAGPASVARFSPPRVVDRWEQLLRRYATIRC